MSTPSSSDGKKSGFFSSIFGSGNSAPVASNTGSIGVNLNIDNKGLSLELDEVKGKISKTNQKYRDEIDKYKKIADFNKKLTSSYITNINTMVDVSKLLVNYAAFFAFLKDELAKTDNTIGSLTTEDIQYLESLTKAKMEQFSNNFADQANKIKVLYNKYGQQEEAARITTAQENIKATIENAGTTYQTLLNTTKPAAATAASGQLGGRRNQRKSAPKRLSQRGKASSKTA